MPDRSLRPTTYVVNRHVRIVPRHDRAERGWLVEAPVRGEGLRQSHVDASERPGVHRVFERLLHDGDREPAIDAATAAELVELGVLVPTEAEARPVRFRVAADDGGPVGHDTAPGLRLDPAVRLVEAAGPDPLDSGVTVEVPDPATGVTLPYWVDEAQAAAVTGLVDDRLDVPSLPPPIAASLARIGVLHDPARAADRRTRTETRFADVGAAMAARGFAVLHDVLPRSYVTALRRYHRRIIAEGFVGLGDAQSPRRYARHNEPLAVWLHTRLTPLVRRALPGPVKPSYAYLVGYLEGASLAEHTDRNECTYTLALAVDAEPDGPRDEAWPLLLTDPGTGEVSEIRLAPGDAVLFRGREVPHARDALPAGRRVTSLLLHFVDASHEGPLS